MADRGDDEITGWALAAGRGDRVALTAFVRATQRDVHRFLAHLINPREADDLAQETFLRALGALPGFAGRSGARTWLLAIARRVGADHLRAAGRRPRTSPVDDWDAVARVEPRPAAVRSGVDEGIALRALIEKLDTDRREAFVLTQLLDLSYAEAAEVCGCPIGTIRSRVARAREDLVTAMQAPAEPRRRISGV
ncbi:sigma-70 family RNA polymerase sigma factor [Pseudonocardia bannensis]|uniref:RNA polymerase sigma factor n=1 Tax=Pseudonocardia bannensis TaxID=630973 RepID=A0A848DKB8_9PSEU|nr:sigma-70 family RNA polymerase sigma factor [Pseudonocardia bannensis]NMH92993.1 sigma-70 family RNA polymerase sigma factor [Pseudonocardia bannensis]